MYSELSKECLKIKVDFSETGSMDNLKLSEWLGLYLIGEASASKMCEVLKINMVKWREFERDLYGLILEYRPI